jgi:hypothetical protein
MKLIFASLIFVVTVALTAGLYLAIRTPAQKKTDLDKLYSLPRQIAERVRQFGDYLLKLFGPKPESTVDQPAIGPIDTAA